MENATSALRSLFTQDGEGVGSGGTGVNDEGQARGAGSANVAAKTLALPFQFGNAAPAFALGHLVVVQPGLADGDDARVLRGVHEGGFISLGAGAGFIFRVHANAGPQLRLAMRVPFGLCKSGGKLFHRGADGERAGDARSVHGIQHLRQLPCKFGHDKVAVRVGKHESSKKIQPQAGALEAVCLCRATSNALKLKWFAWSALNPGACPKSFQSSF